MGWLSGLLSKTVNDPILGRLEYIDGTWRGQIEWPNKPQPVGLFYHSKSKPDAALRERIEIIKQTTKRLERELQQAFFDLWLSKASGLSSRYERADKPPDLWRLLQMDSLNIDDSPQVQLIFSFRAEELSEACFEAMLEDDKLLSVDIDC